MFELSPAELSEAHAKGEKGEIVDEKVRPSSFGEKEEQDWVLVPSFQPSIHSPEWELVTFTTTPKISSYLIAFANGELESVFPRSSSPSPR